MAPGEANKAMLTTSNNMEQSRLCDNPILTSRKGVVDVANGGANVLG